MMRYHWCPRIFPWRNWEDLWRNNLPDLASIKDLAPKTIFVAIDTEPWLDHDGQNINDKEPREIGIAVLSPTADKSGQTSKPPRTLQETYQRFSISSSCIRIRARERPTGEKFWNGGADAMMFVEPRRVEEVIVNILDTAQQSSCSFDGSLLMLTLVGFGLNTEFRIFAHQYPRALSCFTSWIDVQELAKENTMLSEAPSLRNTLIAFGYEPGYPTSTARNDGHNAGNDAMRLISARVSLLFFPSQCEVLAETHMNYLSSRARQRKHRQRDQINMKKFDLFDKRCPWPRENYPFLAKGDLPGACFPRETDAGDLCEYFLRFRPVAAGSNRANEFGGWICLASLEELDRFVEEVHGLEDVEGRRNWIATSLYDPKVVPATTAAELDDFLRQKAIAEIAEKRRIRQKRKENEAPNEAHDDGFR